ncbi:MAG: carbohydrate binding domain-containing protein [Opitutaceae bacterium]|nr:carbohydrate binding domain-containing protein [Verrucomicrobiales bacterium]
MENPSFTFDLAGWNLEVNGSAGAAATIARDSTTYDSAPAGCRITVTNQGGVPGDIRLFRDHLSLSRGKVYRLRFRARASADFSLARPRLVPRANPNSPFDAAISPWSGHVSTRWETYTVEFTPDLDTNDARLEFALGDAGPDRVLWLDDVTMSEITGHPSILGNPSFDLDLGGWTLRTAGKATASCRQETATYESSPACAGITVSVPGGAASDIQFVTNGLSITAGKVYRVSFRVRATAEFTLSPARLVSPTPPNADLGLAAKAPGGAITNTWSTWTTEFMASTTRQDAMLAIELGHSVPAGASVYFDDITFKEVYEHPSVDTTLQNANIGVRKRDESDLSAQDQFWYDAVNRRLVLWSNGNPAALHATIECALSRYMCNIVGRSHIIIDGLAFWNGAKDCIQLDRANDILVTNCDLRFIGGGYTSRPGSTIRFGNAFQLWNTVSNITITENYVLNIYDAGISNQGLSINQQHHLYYRYNTLLACHYSFELWDRPIGSTMHDVYFEHNLCRDAGTSFSYAQRRDPHRASHVLLALTTATSSRIAIRHNLFDTSVRYLIWRTPDVLDNIADWDIDYNTYQQSSGSIALWARTEFGPGEWVQYQKASGKDAHSSLK